MMALRCWKLTLIWPDDYYGTDSWIDTVRFVRMAMAGVVALVVKDDLVQG